MLLPTHTAGSRAPGSPSSRGGQFAVDIPVLDHVKVGPPAGLLKGQQAGIHPKALFPPDAVQVFHGQAGAGGHHKAPLALVLVFLFQNPLVPGVDCAGAAGSGLLVGPALLGGQPGRGRQPGQPRPAMGTV